MYTVLHKFLVVSDDLDVKLSGDAVFLDLFLKRRLADRFRFIFSVRRVLQFVQLLELWEFYAS